MYFSRIKTFVKLLGILTYRPAVFRIPAALPSFLLCFNRVDVINPEGVDRPRIARTVSLKTGDNYPDSKPNSDNWYRSRPDECSGNLEPGCNEEIGSESANYVCGYPEPARPSKPPFFLCNPRPRGPGPLTPRSPVALVRRK